MWLRNKTEFLLLAKKFSQLTYQFIYLLSPYKFLKARPNSPYFVLFQGFQIPTGVLQLNLALPIASHIEQTSVYHDLFGFRHYTFPIFSKLAQVIDSWRAIALVFTQLCSKFFIFAKIVTRLNVNSLENHSPSINSNLAFKSTLVSPIIFENKKPTVFFNSLVLSMLDSYLLTDSMTELSKNLALCQDLSKRLYAI